MSHFKLPDSAPCVPDAEAIAHSQRLQALIDTEIKGAGGRIPYVQYMQLALYAPGLGYYSAGAQKFGAGGDFITAPEMSPLFARCLARQCTQVLTLLGGGDVLEVGAGSGLLAAELLDTMAETAGLPAHYLILELSAELRVRQQKLLKERHPRYFDHIIWLHQLPEQDFRGVIIANELLDAMPVHVFTMHASEPRELYVVSASNGFGWEPGPLSHHDLLDRIRDIEHQVGDLPPGYTSEINFTAEAWLRSIAERCAAGVLLCIDYGYPRREYYHPQRSSGTLMCHYRHFSHTDPLRNVGLQDITACIDFTAIAEAGDAAGLRVAGYTTQGMFLSALGITEYLDAAPSPLVWMQWLQQIKRLTLLHEMGETFKVMALSRGIDEPLQGFTLRDLRDRL